jgi:hypothetical protein
MLATACCCRWLTCVSMYAELSLHACNCLLLSLAHLCVHVCCAAVIVGAPHLLVLKDGHCVVANHRLGRHKGRAAAAAAAAVQQQSSKVSKTETNGSTTA